MTTATATDTVALPKLCNGDHLDADTFLRRWEAMPELRHAELIGGKVYLMASPVSVQHGDPHARVLGWLWAYQMLTPGLKLLPDNTTRFDDENVVQPDAQLNLPGHARGQTGVSPEGYVTGVPDLVTEVAFSGENKDLHENFELYQAAGLREYLVWRTRQDAIDWWANGPQGFQPIQPDSDGVMHSGVFPGLCLDPQMLIHGRDAEVFQLVQQACANSEAHRALVQRLS